MVPLASLVSDQIRYLLQGLDSSDSNTVFKELLQFVDYGSEGHILLLRTCLNHMSFDREDAHKMQLWQDILSMIFRYLLHRPDFGTVFCQSLSSIVLSEKFLEDFCNTVCLTTFEKIALGLSLSESENSETRINGQNFSIAHIKELCGDPASIDSAKQIQNIIAFLCNSEGLAKHVGSFMQILSLMDLKYGASPMLAPLLSDNLSEASYPRNLDILDGSCEDEFDAILAEMESESSVADVMRELGYGCTMSSSHCKEVLSLFSPLTEVNVSKILGTVVQTCTGLNDNQSSYSAFCSAIGSSAASDLSCFSSWNVDILVDSIHLLAPELNWIQVMENLDHEGFNIPNEGAFSMLMSVYAQACQEPFPLHAVCGSIWRNSDGQLSFLKHAVSASSEIFTFAHSVHKLVYDEVLPGYELPHGLENHAWLSIDLLEVLCQLAERGHARSVWPMLEFPLEHSPEILLLGISQINTPYSILQCDVSSAVFPLVVANGMGSVLRHIWLSNPELVVRGLIDMIGTDCHNMRRILDICQEMKILPLFLEQIPLSTGIRLAVLAYQKQCINLEMWLNYSLNSYKDIFFKECLKFLKDISSDKADGIYASLFQHSGTETEIASTFLKVLDANSQKIASDHLVEELRRLQCAFVNVSPQLENDTLKLAASDAYTTDIEAEANSYFDKLFSGQVPVDVMIQMLERFKESSDTREQSTFECMVHNLFEEYQFFPRYPEKQLKIAAVLFGSLIKHRLLTQITLGVALRFVLDALRKPTDSKMFAFGTTALQQFLDCLIEFPQYCNHILQISHLCGTHPELVAFVQHVLDRISPGHSETRTLSSETDGQNGSTTVATLENLEFVGSRNTWPAEPLPSTHEAQKRHSVFISDKHKSATTPNVCSNPLPPSSGPPNISATIMASSHNLTASQSLQTSSTQYVTSVSALASSSAGVLHSSGGSTSTSTVRKHSYNTGFGSALNIQTLIAAAEKRDTTIEAPAADIQDKILFMINNISTSNIDGKAKEFTEVLNEQYFPWFAQYMVMKRASIEPNFHDLYLKFLDKINSRALNKEIEKAAYENCRVLLRSELIKSSSEERSLLKNLGSWLGKLTIGKNRALLFREIDPKSLIIEAYEKGLMIAVIPFTSKILEPCPGSLAYRPPNPWTMAILSLLAEIYALPNLKMNLKFDIEVLFKNLGVDLKEVKPASLLKNRVRELEGNPDFSVKDLVASQPRLVPEIHSGIFPTMNQTELQPEIVTASHPGGHLKVLPQYASGFHLPSGPPDGDEKMAGPSLSDRIHSGPQSAYPLGQAHVPSPVPNTGRSFIVNQKLNVLGRDYFQSIVPVAMEMAIKDVTSPVVQRSLAIAIQTTKEVVLKDYGIEFNEKHIYHAAHLMVASLAGSLAHVTCKEPLRGSLSSHLRNALHGLNIAHEILEQAVALIINDNLDLGCAMIEQAASEKALQAIDEEIAKQLSVRRKQREDIGAFCDASFYTQGPVGVLPEALRHGQGRLSLSQQRVYEDFVQFPWRNHFVQNINAVPSGGSANSGSSRTYVSSAGKHNPGFHSADSVTTGPSAVTQPLILIPEDMEPSSVQHFSGSSIHVGGTDGSSTQGPQSGNVASFPSTAAVSVVHSLNVTAAVKGVAAITPSLSTSSTLEQLGSGIPEQSLPMASVLEKYLAVSHKLETLLSKDSGEMEIQGVITQIPEMILKCVNRDEVALAVAQKVFKSLYENTSNALHVNAHLSILVAIRDVCKLVVKELTSWVIYSDEERKFNAPITLGLICKGLLNLAEYNMHVAKLIDAGRNKAATEFSTNLLSLLVQESRDSVSELPNLVDALAKVASKPGSSESLLQLVEILKNPDANPGILSSVLDKEDRSKQPREMKSSDHTMASKEDNTVVDDSAAIDLAGNRDQISQIFAEWYQICGRHGTENAVTAAFLTKLQKSGYLNGDEMSQRFFRILTELCVAHCLSSEGTRSSARSIQLPASAPNLSFVAIDVYAKLVSLILRNRLMEPGPNKCLIWPKILLVIVDVLQRDAKEKQETFNARPYYRLFINWLLDLATEDPVTDGALFQILMTFANTFHALQPLEVPAFSFAWLELVSHRSFMPKMLTVNAPSGWIYVQRLLIDLFKFMEPYLRNAELQNPIQALYRGTLRVLLVLLHDFPEFLSDYHFSFCDVIPSSCIQMRNVILSAFPRNMRLPDPSTPNLKIDLLPEMHMAPHIYSEVDAALKAKQMKSDIDDYLKTRSRDSPFLSEIKQRLLLPQTEATQAGTQYNVPLMNSLVLYMGMQTVQQLQTKNPHTNLMAHNVPMELYLISPALDILQTLMLELDTEGRYYFLNAMANQLRYPNSHTHLFSFIILYLFNEANQEIVQEQITRVLLERLIVQRPHPWGLLATFIELIKNPRYNFWNRSFTRCAPEIEKLFESVSRSCGGARHVDEGMASGAIPENMH